MKVLFLKISLLIITLLLLQSCSIDSFDQSSSELTFEESLIAGQIIGESVSENQNGLLSSFSEAFAIPTESNLIAGPSPLSTGSFRNLENYSYEFDSETGVHKVTFSRQDNNELFTTTSEYTLNYVFYDINQNVIEFPGEQQNQIEAVEYTALRNGEILADTKSSVFTRTDRLFIDGLSSDTDILTIDGYHSGEGFFTRIKTDSAQTDREYLLDINYLDIRINKPIVLSSRNFRKGVTGALSYESTIRQTGNGNYGSETKIVNGTVELNGDGTALLRFRELFDTFRLRLANGELFDDEEFEGRVTRVNLQERIFTISNGQRIQINNQTEIKDEDFNTLEEVAAAINNGVRVIAEGDYFHPDENVNLWIATEVEFELESNEFEDLVASVDLAENSFTLVNGDQFFITDKSEVEFDDDFDTLEEVAEAVQAGLPVEADGDFYIDIETGERIVKEVEFEFDFDEFDEQVISVNLTENTFTIESGKVILITESTVIDDDGDFLTLEEVANALDEGEEVGAKGKFYFDTLSGFWIAVEVEFFD
jgi:hypothetical protein